MGDVHAGDGEDVAFDDGFPAVGTPSCLRAFKAGHVADINAVQSPGAGGIAGFHQRFNGCRRQVRKLVLRIKPREVQRPVRSQLFQNPAAHPADGGGGLIN